MLSSTKCSYWLDSIVPPLYKNLPGSKTITRRLFNELGFRAKRGGWENLDHSWSPWLKVNSHTLTVKRYRLTTKSRDFPWLAGTPSPQSTGDTVTASCFSPTLLLTKERPTLSWAKKAYCQNRQVGTELHCSHFDWLWCSDYSATSASWNGIFPQWWGSHGAIVSLTRVALR